MTVGQVEEGGQATGLWSESAGEGYIEAGSAADFPARVHLMTMATAIRIGTRGSRLARWQAEWVADHLRGLHPGLTVELVEIKTQGDRDRNSPLAAIGGVGVVTQGDQRAGRGGAAGPAGARAKGRPTPGPPA